MKDNSIWFVRVGEMSWREWLYKAFGDNIKTINISKVKVSEQVQPRLYNITPCEFAIKANYKGE